MQKLLFFLILILLPLASFAQETTVNAKLTGEADKKDMILIGIDSKSISINESLESTVSSSSTFPTLVSILKIQPNGKITGNKTFWVFDEEYQITGNVEDFSTIKISPNHPYNSISTDFYSADEEKQKEIIAENLDNAVGVKLLASSVSSYSDEELQSLLNQIPEALYVTEYYKEIKTDFLTKDVEKPKVGDRASDFELESRNGEIVSLSDFAGKYRLLDFSNSGCGPCFMALPEIKEAYEKFGSEIEVISIWDDKTKDIWMNSSKKHKEQIIWTDLWDAEGFVTSLYQVKILPSYILVNPDGEIEKIWNSYRKGKILREMDSVFGKK